VPVRTLATLLAGHSLDEPAQRTACEPGWQAVGIQAQGNFDVNVQCPTAAEAVRTNVTSAIASSVARGNSHEQGIFQQISVRLSRLDALTKEMVAQF
jgi:hypothetical protein